MQRILVNQSQNIREGVNTLIEVLQFVGMRAGNHKLIVRRDNGEKGTFLISNHMVYSIEANGYKSVEACRCIFDWKIEEIIVDEIPGEIEIENLGSSCISVNELLLKALDNIPDFSDNEQTNQQYKEVHEMETTTERIRSILVSFVETTGGMESILLVDSEGFIIASHGVSFEKVEGLEMVGGIITSLISMTTKVAGELQTGGFDRIMLHGYQRHIFIAPVGNGINALIVTKPDAVLGMIFASLKKLTTSIQPILGGM